MVSIGAWCVLFYSPQYRTYSPYPASTPFRPPGVYHEFARILANPRSSGFSCYTRPRLDAGPCPSSRRGIRTAHLILRRCAKQSSELRLANASQCRIFNAEATLYALKMEE